MIFNIFQTLQKDIDNLVCLTQQCTKYVYQYIALTIYNMIYTYRYEIIRVCIHFVVVMTTLKHSCPEFWASPRINSSWCFSWVPKQNSQNSHPKLGLMDLQSMSQALELQWFPTNYTQLLFLKSDLKRREYLICFNAVHIHVHFMYVLSFVVPS